MNGTDLAAVGFIALMLILIIAFLTVNGLPVA